MRNGKRCEWKLKSFLKALMVKFYGRLSFAGVCIFYECGGGVADTIFHRDHLSSSYSFSIYSRLPFPISHCLLFLILFFLIINHIPLQSIFFKDFDRTLNMRFHCRHHHHFLTMGLFSFPVKGSLEVLSIFLKHFIGELQGVKLLVGTPEYFYITK